MNLNLVSITEVRTISLRWQVGSLQACRSLSVLVPVLILFPDIWLIWYLSGHVILSDRAAEFSQVRVGSVERNTVLHSPMIKERVFCDRSDIFAELSLDFSVCQVFVQQYIK